MLSCILLILVIVLPALLTAWILSRAARAMGSSRSKFRHGIWVVLIISAANIGLTLAGGYIPPVHSVSAAIAVAILTLAVQVFVVFQILARYFQLEGKRAFGMLGAYIAITLAGVGFAFFVYRPYLSEAFVIPSASMGPTLEPGDRIVANKLIRPRRMDIIVYWNDEEDPRVYCKRLIGLPGERIRFQDGGIFIDNEPLALPPFLAGRCHAFVGNWPTSSDRYKDGETIVLGDNEFFLIGDDVQISADSRNNGPTPRTSLIGVVDLKYWPLNEVQFYR